MPQKMCSSAPTADEDCAGRRSSTHLRPVHCLYPTPWSLACLLPPPPPPLGVTQQQNSDWVLATCEYGGEFVAAVQRGAVSATQFHPEKSGGVGLDILGAFLDPQAAQAAARLQAPVVDTGEQLVVVVVLLLLLARWP